MLPKVSIILPTYNGAKYIKKSIESIIDQTFHDWELIIVDDCSTDETPLIIRKYVEIDKRIKYIRNEKNQKLPNSLNIGFSNAIGKYLTWTSDDNYYLPQALKKMYDYLENNTDVCMVCADMQSVDESGKLANKEPVYDDKRIFVENHIGACFLYRCKVLEEIGQYNQNLVYVEDYDYWFRIRMRYGSIHRIPEVLYCYRRHNESLSIMKRKEVCNQLKNMREKYIDYIIDKLRNDDEALYRVFYETYCMDASNSVIIHRIAELLPEILPLINKKERNRNIAIFGAGSIGKKILRSYSERVELIVDNDMSKAGQKIDNVPVYAFEEIQQHLRQVHIIVAVSAEKQLSIIRQLYSRGIRDYSIYRLIEG